MRIKDLLGKHSKESKSTPKVLVCSFGKESNDLEIDGLIYKRFYKEVDTARFSSIEALLQMIAGRYDIVHLLCSLSAGGSIIDANNAALTGSDLINACYVVGVKLLWIASDNSARNYIDGFKTFGKPINLIMTISRNSSNFPIFLERLLSRISSGNTLPSVWVSLVPQAEGPWQQELPSCILSAGAGSAQLSSSVMIRSA